MKGFSRFAGHHAATATSQLAGITSSSHPEHDGDAGTLALGIFYKGSLVVLTGPRRASRFRTSAPAFSGAVIWPTGRRTKHNASSACSVAVGQVCSKLVGRKPASRFKAKRSASITNQHVRVECSWRVLPFYGYVCGPRLCRVFVCNRLVARDGSTLGARVFISRCGRGPLLWCGSECVPFSRSGRVSRHHGHRRAAGRSACSGTSRKRRFRVLRILRVFPQSVRRATVP